MRTSVVKRRVLWNNNGATLVELVIVTFLFFGLLTLATMFMMRGKRMSVRTETLARTQMEAVKLARKLGEDLNRGTLSQGSGQWANGSLIFLSSKPSDSSTGPVLEFDSSTGSVIWKQWVAYYLEPATEKVRRFSKPLSPPVPDPLMASGSWDLPDLPGLDPSTGHAVAVGIVDFFPTGRASDNTMEFAVKARGMVPLGNVSENEKIVEVEIASMIRMGAGTP